METSNSWVQHQWFLGFFPRIFFISKSYPRQWKKALVFELYEMTSMTCINFPRKTSCVWYFMGVSWSHQVVFIQIRSLPTCRWKKPVAPVEVGSVCPIIYQVFAPSQMFVLDIWTINRSSNLCIRGFPTGEAKNRRKPTELPSGGCGEDGPNPTPRCSSYATWHHLKRLVSGRCKKQVVVEDRYPIPKAHRPGRLDGGAKAEGRCISWDGKKRPTSG